MSAGQVAGLLLGILASETIDTFRPRGRNPSEPTATARDAQHLVWHGPGAVAVTGSALVIDTLIGRRGGRSRFPVRMLATAVSVGTVARSVRVARTGTLWGQNLEAGSLDVVRQTLGSMDRRCTENLDVVDLSRVSLEAVAEQTSRSVVTPLFWAAAAGMPGLFVWQVVAVLREQEQRVVDETSRQPKRLPLPVRRCRNRILNRLDAAVHMLPSRIAAMLVVVAAPVVGGSAQAAWRAWRRDVILHPYPDTGRAQSAFAGALNVRLGGVSTYPHGREDLPVLGHGCHPDGGHVIRAAELSRVVGWFAGVTSVLTALLRGLCRRIRR